DRRSARAARAAPRGCPAWRASAPPRGSRRLRGPRARVRTARRARRGARRSGGRRRCAEGGRGERWWSWRVSWRCRRADARHRSGMRNGGFVSRDSVPRAPPAVARSSRRPPRGGSAGRRAEVAPPHRGSVPRRAEDLGHNGRMTPTSATAETVQALLRSAPQSEAQLEQLAREAQTLPIVELVYLVETRPDTEAAILFRVLDKDTALAVFESLPAPHQAELISALRTQQVADIITDLDPDDRASLLDELPASVAERLLHGLDADQRAMTTAVRGYPREAIGRYMSPEVLTLAPGMTAGDALAHVRLHAEEPETIYLLPVVDRSRVLLGVVGLRRLLVTDPDVLVGDLAHEAVHATATDDREQVARRFFAAKLLAMPIVDGEGRLVGVLTVDDAVDIIEQE